MFKGNFFSDPSGGSGVQEPAAPGQPTPRLARNTNNNSG